MNYLNPNARWTLVLLTVLSPIAVSLMLAGPFTDKGTQPESMTNPLIPPGNCQTCHSEIAIPLIIELLGLALHLGHLALGDFRCALHVCFEIRRSGA